ncbi:helix-turn-helix domain-containing protein [Microbacterium resistens]|uniref:helix-turn-helix domain-containing protein n=1 Tax=Microbacterium resistens TaxID=156977 RepID=UPI000835C03E|nr:helix-turn-helix transcriptional regulator [Microbacterium resistens]
MTRVHVRSPAASRDDATGPGPLDRLAALLRREHLDGRLGGVVIALPGMWGAPSLYPALLGDGGIVVQPFRTGEGGTELVVHAATDGSWLLAPDAVEPARLAEWTAPPLILIERADQLAPADAVRLGGIAARGDGFLVVLTPTLSSQPAAFRDLVIAGSLRQEVVRPVDALHLRRIAGELLGGPVSVVAASRLSALTGGQPGILQTVASAAVHAGALVHDGGEWTWDRRGARALGEALSASADVLMGGLSSADRHALLVTALADSVPETAAREHLGHARIASLREQGMLAVERFATGRRRSLRLRIGVLRTLLLDRARPGERMRLWHDVGRHLAAGPIGDSAEVGLATWQVGIGETFPRDETRRLVGLALGVGAFEQARVLAAGGGADDPVLRVLRARADAALGDVSSALAAIPTLTGQLSDAPIADARDAWREAALLLARLALFRPEARDGLRQLLAEASSSSLAPVARAVLDASPLLEALAAHGDPVGTPAMRASAGSACPSEEMTARLWLGAHLAFGGDPHTGRQMLLTLLDDAHREPGLHEYTDPAAALLLILQEQYGWRPVDADLPLWVREYDVIGSPRLAPVLDVTNAVRMARAGLSGTARRQAQSAARLFDESDPFGLGAFARALAEATDPSIAPDARRLPASDAASPRRSAEPAEGASGTPAGFWALEDIGRGLRAYAAPTAGATPRDALLRVADETGAAGRHPQRLELLFMALMAGSEEAAKRILAEAGAVRTTRIAVSEAVAAALLSDSGPSPAFDVIRLLLDHGAAFMAFQVLTQVWQRPLDRPEDRRAAVRYALEVHRSVGDQPWVSSSFVASLLPTPRERDVLAQLMDGSSTRAIATRMRLSPRTIEGVISRMLRRYGCANRVELLALDLL